MDTIHTLRQQLLAVTAERDELQRKLDRLLAKIEAIKAGIKRP